MKGLASSDTSKCSVFYKHDRERTYLASIKHIPQHQHVCGSRVYAKQTSQQQLIWAVQRASSLCEVLMTTFNRHCVHDDVGSGFAGVGL